MQNESKDGPVEEALGELVKYFSIPWDIEKIQRHIRFTEWTTGIGIALLTLAFPLLTVSGQIRGMSFPLKFTLWYGSLIVFASVVAGILFNLLFHSNVNTEACFDFLRKLDKDEEKLLFENSYKTVEKETTMSREEFREKFYDVLSNSPLFRWSFKKMKFKANCLFLVHVELFSIGLLCVIVPLLYRFASVIL
jgi:hypothetical protein